MNQLETALASHDWGMDGYATRPGLDQLMKSHTDPTVAQALWQQHCPWSNTNGGYVKWAKKFTQDDKTMVWHYI